jgi:hypothetical protein
MTATPQPRNGRDRDGYRISSENGRLGPDESRDHQVDRAANKAERDRLVARLQRLLDDPGNTGLPHADFVRHIEEQSERTGSARRHVEAKGTALGSRGDPLCRERAGGHFEAGALSLIAAADGEDIRQGSSRTFCSSWDTAGLRVRIGGA